MKIKKIFVAVNICGAIILPRLAFAQWEPESLVEFGLPGNTISEIIAGVMYWLLMILGVIGVIGFAIAGILYLTAAGNEDQSKRAKRAMTYSIIGVIVGLLGLVVLSAAVNLLRAQIF